MHQLGERELDVLAGAERVGGEVRAGAGIVAEGQAANGDAIGIPALRIGDLELGKSGMIAEIAQAKLLLAAELPAQLGLPLFERHVGGLLQSRQLGIRGLRLEAGRSVGGMVMVRER